MNPKREISPTSERDLDEMVEELESFVVENNEEMSKEDVLPEKKRKVCTLKNHILFF